jgi:TonB family protein
MFEQLFNSPFLYSLSLTLVHFIWQGLLVALILKSVLFIIDKNKSKLRYALATMAMLANAVLAVLTFTMVYPDTSSGINSSLSPIPLTSLVNELTQQNALLSYQELLPSILAHSLPYLSLLWLATIAILASKLLIEIRNVNNLPLHSSISPSSALLSRFDELAKQIKLTKTPTLLISLKAEVPMAIGWLKPVVLLPASMVTGLDSAQLEMLILHELAHIRRHDYLVNFLQTLIELLFFFHPSVHWIGKQMRNEREYCSDDIAVQHCGDAIAYAHTLTDTASLCAKKHFHTIPTMAMAASGGDLKARVLRLVDHHCAPANTTSKWLAAMSLLLALTLLSINQLLTMPFAQQLNNQFPWQESNALSKSIFNKRIENYLVNTDMQKKSLTSDSIAQQLLGQKEIDLNTPFIINDEPPKASQLIIKRESVVSEPVIANQSNALLIKTKEKRTTTNIKQVPKNISVQKTDKDITRLDLKITERELDLGDKKLDIASNKPTLTLTTKRAKITPVPLVETKPKRLFNSKKNNIQLVKNKELNQKIISPSSKYTDDLKMNNSTYQQISYRQEIDKLSMNDGVYQASHAIRTASSLPISTDKLRFTSPKISKPKVSLEAKLLNSVSPVYPSLAKRRGIEMEVKVDFIIDRNGKVKNINFAQQSKLIYFKSSIRSAIRKWRFSPATQNNRKVESKMSKIFSFSLQA